MNASMGVTAQVVARSILLSTLLSILLSAVHPGVLADSASSPPVARAAPAPKPSGRKPAKAASQLDLSVRDLRDGKAVSPENPNYTASALADDGGGDPEAGTTAAERSAAAYATEPLFQSEQRLQILDTEVPVSVKLGKWKTSEESKALGLSATVPLKVLE